MILLSFLVDAGGECSHEVSAQTLDVRKLAEFLRNNFNRAVYLDELAGLAAMSKSTLLRHFKIAFGMTPMVYLLNIRLCYAAELLVNTSLSVKEIAEASGFPSEAYFFRAFKKNRGVSPSDYRSAGNTERPD